MSYSAFLSNVGDTWTRRVACSDCPLYYKCQVIVKQNACADFLLSELRAEIAKEIDGKHEEGGS